MNNMSNTPKLSEEEKSELLAKSMVSIFEIMSLHGIKLADKKTVEAMMDSYRKGMSDVLEHLMNKDYDK